VDPDWAKVDGTTIRNENINVSPKMRLNIKGLYVVGMFVFDRGYPLSTTQRVQWVASCFILRDFEQRGLGGRG
jgi:hypothetical protein